MTIDSLSESYPQICTFLSTFFTRKDKLLRKSKAEAHFLAETLFKMMMKWDGEVDVQWLKCETVEDETPYVYNGAETIAKIFEF